MVVSPAFYKESTEPSDESENHSPENGYDACGSLVGPLGDVQGGEGENAIM